MPIVAYAGDIHAGSLTAICPPSVPLNRGGEYHANRPQAAIWSHWLDFWDRVRDLAREHDQEIWGVVGGEFCEGAHHGTTSIISANMADQRRIARRVFKPVKALAARWYVVRGSDSHSGESGRDDEQLGQYLGAMRAPGGEDRSTEVVRICAGGHNLRFQHHGWGSARPWTKGGNTLRHAAALTYEHYNSAENERPHVSVHGHFHSWNDSHDAHPIRVIYAGGWKYDDGYILRLNVTDNPTIVGGLILIAKEGEPLGVEKVKLHPARPKYAC